MLVSAQLNQRGDSMGLDLRVATLLAASAAITFGMLAPGQASTSVNAPGVINGIPYPPLSGAAVALETDEGYFCSGSLWRSRILATAAHCLEDENGKMVPADHITLWAPGSDSNGPPSGVRVTDIIVDEDWFTYAEDDYEATARDLAFLILDQPLGTPVWTRMATPAEAAALTWNGAKVEFVGYGSTSPSVDPNAQLSALPGGVNSSLDWGYDSGLGVFNVLGNEVTGTCGGDSGGPWMNRLGNEILYLGPLSSGQGLPCDKPEPPGETLEFGAVASANTDLLNVALATAGESASPVPTTCMKGEDIKRECWPGRAWEYEFCWSAKKAELWKWQGGDNWKRVDRFTGYKDEDCAKDTPYLIIFRGIETKKNTWYEVYLPPQAGSREEWVDPFKVTVN